MRVHIVGFALTAVSCAADATSVYYSETRWAVADGALVGFGGTSLVLAPLASDFPWANLTLNWYTGGCNIGSAAVAGLAFTNPDACATSDVAPSAVLSNTHNCGGAYLTPASYTLRFVSECQLTLAQQAATYTACAIAEEHSFATVRCPSGLVVSGIDFASFGQPTGSCGSFVQGACHAPSSVSAVTAACLGMTSCSVLASDSVFSDPCYDSPKSLFVQARCSQPPGSPTSTSASMTWTRYPAPAACVPVSCTVPSSTPTASLSPTPPVTSSLTAASTASFTPSPSVTPTGTPTPRQTTSTTATKSSAPSVTTTASQTQTTTPSESTTASQTSTPAQTPSASATRTTTRTTTPCESTTASQTSTPAQTPSASQTQTATPSVTTTASQSSTPSGLPQASQTHTGTANVVSAAGVGAGPSTGELDTLIAFSVFTGLAALIITIALVIVRRSQVRRGVPVASSPPPATAAGLPAARPYYIVSAPPCWV